jgi:hypothetical protein
VDRRRDVLADYPLDGFAVEIRQRELECFDKRAVFGFEIASFTFVSASSRSSSPSLSMSKGWQYESVFGFLQLVCSVNRVLDNVWVKYSLLKAS